MNGELKFKLIFSLYCLGFLGIGLLGVWIANTLPSLHAVITAIMFIVLLFYACCAPRNPYYKNNN